MFVGFLKRCLIQVLSKMSEWKCLQVSCDIVWSKYVIVNIATYDLATDIMNWFLDTEKMN